MKFVEDNMDIVTDDIIEVHEDEWNTLQSQFVTSIFFELTRKITKVKK
jgi:hypothetical protein